MCEGREERIIIKKKGFARVWRGVEGCGGRVEGCGGLGVDRHKDKSSE